MLRRLAAGSGWLMIIIAMAVTQVGSADAALSAGSMTDLGSLGDYGYTFAADISNSGQVTGYSDAGISDWHMFLWERGDMVDLGVPPGGTADFVWPAAINNRGMIVGTFRNGGIPDTAAFVFDDGGWTVILPDDAYWTNAVDVNAKGMVLGVESPLYGDLRLFVWRDGVTTYLDLDLPDSGPSAPYIVPVDLTDRGEVVGYYYGYGPVPGEPPLLKSFIWDRGQVVQVEAPGGEKTQAFEMNARGQVVGQYYIGPDYGNTQAFVWDDGTMSDLPGFGGPSGATGINNKGQIVGAAETPGGTMHAVLWEKGEIVDLGTLGGSESYAYAINDRGQVVGWSRTASGAIHAFIWVPSR